MKRTPFRNFALPCLALALIISACGAPLKITITSALQSDSSDYVLTGTVDNVDLIATITYSLNGAQPEPLQLVGNEFSKLIFLDPGTNTIRVVVTATGGQVFTEDVSVVYSPTGTLTVTVAGLPDGGTATIDVSTASGGNVDSVELGNGAHAIAVGPGDYVVTAEDADLPHASYPGDGVAARYVAGAAQAVTVAEGDGGAASASFAYALEGITDPIGDLPSDANAGAYDVLFASAFVSGGTLTVTIEFSAPPALPAAGAPEGAVDDELIAFIQFDLVAGGADVNLGACSPSEAFEHQVDHTLEVEYLEADNSYLLGSDLGGTDLFMTPTIAGNTLTLAGPAPAGSVDGFVPFFGVVANFGTPSDCFPAMDAPVF